MKQFDMSDQGSSEHLGMTHYVDLPTKGEFYPVNHPLKDVDKLEVKMLTTKEEDILTNQSYIENDVVLDKFLESIIIGSFDPREMYDADKTAILVASRIEAYGPSYDIGLSCSGCGEFYSHTIDLESFGTQEPQEKLESTPEGSLLIELPKSKKVIEFRHLLPKEVATIQKTVDKMLKLNISTSFNVEFYKRIILSVDGVQDKEQIGNFIDNLRLMDSRKLFLAYRNSLPTLNTSFTSRCPKCDNVNEGGMPIQANFFFPEF